MQYYYLSLQMMKLKQKAYWLFQDHVHVQVVETGYGPRQPNSRTCNPVDWLQLVQFYHKHRLCYFYLFLRYFTISYSKRTILQQKNCGILSESYTFLSFNADPFCAVSPVAPSLPTLKECSEIWKMGVRCPKNHVPSAKQGFSIHLQE